MKQLIKLLVSFLFLVLYTACFNQNEAPVINSLSANPETIYPNKNTQLTCIASDPEGDKLSYSWSSANGTFSENNTEASLTWNAPEEPGKYTLAVQVNDGKNTTSENIIIEVLQNLNIEGYVSFHGTTIPISDVLIQTDNEKLTTNESGKFIIKAGIGTLNIKADKDGYDSFNENITIEKASDTIRIELTSESFTKRISGFVKNSFDLTPVEGVKVVVLNPDESESQLSTLTLNSGSFELQNVPKGNRQIKLIHPNYRSIQQDVFIAETNINLDLNLACNPPEVATTSNNFAGLDSVLLEGTVNMNCTQNIKTGFCFSEKSNPNIYDNVIEVPEESGLIRKVISNQDVEVLKPYYYRAFVQTDLEVVYGETYSFLLGILMDDRNDETKLYATTKIGEQVWMAENLAYLPRVSPSSEISNTEPGYFVYGYKGSSVDEAKASENYKNYGVLYNWPAALEACPKGWHLPTNEDWEQLAKYISDQKGGYTNNENYWYNVGIHLKASTNWRSNGNGTDEYGFSGFPGGFRSFNGAFFNFETDGFWWSATEENNGSAWYRNMKFSSTSIFRGQYFKNMGYCVRCLKD